MLVEGTSTPLGATPLPDEGAAFLAALRVGGTTVAPDATAWGTLAPLVSAAIERAREAAPRDDFDRIAFARHLGRAASAVVASPVEADTVCAFLRDVHAPELHLTERCASGDPDALAQFEALHFGEVRRALRRIRTEIAPDDFVQTIRERLFVAEPGRRPRIGDYTGRGDLRTWLRVAVTRTLLNLAARKPEATTSDEALLDALPSVGPSPEIELMKRRYAKELREAFANSTARLSVRERALVRHALLDRLSIDAIGAIYGVHRATAARWVNAACDALREHVVSDVTRRLRIDRRELEAIVGMVASRLDVSVRRCLGEDGATSH